MTEAFHKFAKKVSEIAGSPSSFILAIILIAVWGLTGPWFNYSNTWQLIINTGTTILTFLMVFLIQNTQNRDSKAVQLKLDELIKASGPARNSLIELEDMSDEELSKLEQQFKRIQQRAENKTKNIA